MASDLTLEVLKQIRDGIGQTNARLDGMDARFERMDERFERMEKRLERVEVGLNDLGGFMKQIALDQARHERFHAEHGTLLERDMADLKERVQRLEQRTTT